MYRQVADAGELGTFFRQQVLMILFIAKCAKDLAALNDVAVLMEFFRRHGDSLSEEDAVALMLLLAVMVGGIPGGAAAQPRAAQPARRAIQAAPPARAAIQAAPARVAAAAAPVAKAPAASATRPAATAARLTPAAAPTRAAAARGKKQDCCVLQ